MNNYEVIIIGGGISGLCAARKLESSGRTWHLLESRSRLGGRTLRVPGYKEDAFEAGGEFLKPGHERILQLVSELELPTIPVHNNGGLDLYVSNGVVHQETSPFSWSPELHTKYVQLQQRIQDHLVSSRHFLSSPLTSDDISLDGLSVHEWLSSLSTSTEAITRAARNLTFGMAGEPRETSSLAALTYLASAGTAPANGMGQQVRLVGGGSSLVKRLADGLPSKNIQLNSTVESITQTRDGAIVRVNGDELFAEQVIVAMSPRLASGISFGGEQRVPRTAAHKNWTQQSGVKTALYFDRPWWRELGLSGFAEGDLGVQYVLETTPEHAQYGMLTALANEGTTFPKSLSESPDAALTRVLSDIKTYFGDNFIAPVHSAMKIWSHDALAGGCGSPLPPGFLSAYAPALASGDEHIIWAGTEHSPTGWCSMEGAVVAGEAAATKAAGSLRSP